MNQMIVVPPPPLPPSLPLNPSSSSKENLVAQHLLNHQIAIPAQEEVCRAYQRVFGNHPQHEVVISLYEPISAVIQNGPSCGLVALQMAARALRLQTPAVDDILQLGRSLGFTVQGEMFSASRLGRLAELLLDCKVQLVTEGLRSEKVLQHLVEGKPMLVPYDADFNHEPCCKKGHKAHWATITGFLKIFDATPTQLKMNDLQQDEHLGHVYHARRGYSFDLRTDFGEDLYVLAKQGKSNNLGAWSLDTLATSNANLTEVDPRRSNETSRYILPEGGIVEGLKNKVLLLSSKDV